MPGNPATVTVCGLDTAGMAVDPWRQAAPGKRWYPPGLARHVCPRCDRAVRSVT
ncbi:hypothetical protein [Kitasatospora sp. NPDC057541]|uniref:hypothetical protein n=1 Tax=Kitasatospora sp. NPDC057541 TaxID=3346161 RepID=UPI0036852815